MDELDTKKTYAYDHSANHSQPLVFDASIQTKAKPHEINQSLAGFTLHGAVAISSPPSPDDHDRHLGYQEPETHESYRLKDRNQRFADAAEILGELMRWMAASDNLASLGLRAAAMIALVAPHQFDDVDGSQTSIAKKFGVERAAIQQRTRELRTLTRNLFQSRNQRSLDVCNYHSTRALEQHKKAGHKMKAAQHV